MTTQHILATIQQTIQRYSRREHPLDPGSPEAVHEDLLKLRTWLEVLPEDEARKGIMYVEELVKSIQECPTCMQQLYSFLLTCSGRFPDMNMYFRNRPSFLEYARELEADRQAVAYTEAA